MRKEIKLEKVEQVYRLAEVATTKDFPVGVCSIAEERYKINAKSVMGIFTLNLREPVYVCVEDAIEAEALEFFKEIEAL